MMPPPLFLHAVRGSYGCTVSVKRCPLQPTRISEGVRLCPSNAAEFSQECTFGEKVWRNPVWSLVRCETVVEAHSDAAFGGEQQSSQECNLPRLVHTSCSGVCPSWGFTSEAEP
nr:uncharacterized protein LOC112290155 [Physcomitrium patens]|eukprot:XP_024391919.1 uncharacterized protein LOC112290155 [Physcomitrella patens]